MKENRNFSLESYPIWKAILIDNFAELANSRDVSLRRMISKESLQLREFSMWQLNGAKPPLLSKTVRRKLKESFNLN